MNETGKYESYKNVTIESFYGKGSHLQNSRNTFLSLDIFI